MEESETDVYAYDEWFRTALAKSDKDASIVH